MAYEAMSMGRSPQAVARLPSAALPQPAARTTPSTHTAHLTPAINHHRLPLPAGNGQCPAVSTGGAQAARGGSPVDRGAWYLVVDSGGLVGTVAAAGWGLGPGAWALAIAGDQ